MPCYGEMRSNHCLARHNHLRYKLTLLQVEYLVVVYTKEEQKVLLSLRQAEILEALAADADLAKEGCVPALQDEPAIKSKSV